METENIKNKKPWWIAIFCIIVILVEIWLPYKIAYFHALDSGNWEALGAMPYTALALGLSIIGFTGAIYFISRKSFIALSVLLILVSILTFPVVNSKFVRNKLAPLAYPQYYTEEN